MIHESYIEHERKRREIEDRLDRIEEREYEEFHNLDADREQQDERMECNDNRVD